MVCLLAPAYVVLERRLLNEDMSGGNDDACPTTTLSLAADLSDYHFNFFLSALILIFSAPVNRLGGKSISNMTYLVLSGTTARMLASQAKAIVRTGKTWPQATKRRTGD